MTIQTNVRKASEAEHFPYGLPKKVAYFTVTDGVPIQLSRSQEMRDAVAKALNGEVTIYACWPGQWRSDLFVIDDIQALASAVGVS